MVVYCSLSIADNKAFRCIDEVPCPVFKCALTLSQEENPQAAQVAGGSLPRRHVGFRAPPGAEQLHVRRAQDRGGHRGVRHGPGQVRRPWHRPLQHAQGE